MLESASRFTHTATAAAYLNIYDLNIALKSAKFRYEQMLARPPAQS